MARTSLPAAVAGPTPFAIVPASLVWTAADSVNGNQFRVTGRTVLLVRNVSGGGLAVSFVSAPDRYGRLNTGLSGETLGAGAFKAYPMFNPDLWQQADGFVYVTAAGAGIEFAVIDYP